MGFQNRLYGLHKGLLVPMGIITAFDALEKILCIGAVFSPAEHRLIVLIDPSVVGADTDTDPMKYGIEFRFGNRVPCPMDNVYPFMVVRGKGQLVLDLEV